MKIDLDLEICDELDFNLEKLNKLLENINTCETKKDFIESPNSLYQIQFIHYLLTNTDFKEKQNWDTHLEQHNGFQNLIDIFAALSKEFKNVKVEIKSEIPYLDTESESKLSSNEKILFMTNDLASIINIASLWSKKFYLFLLKKSILSIFFDFISEKSIVKKLFKIYPDLIEGILVNITSLSKHSSVSVTKSDWKDLNALTILLNVSKVCDKSNYLIYSALPFIADDSELESLSLMSNVLDMFVLQINECAKSLSSETPNRVKRQLIGETSDQFYESLYVKLETPYKNANYISVNLIGILKVIYTLAINPKIKVQLYEKKDFKESLLVVVQLGNEIEKKYAIQALSQFIFDFKIANEIFNNKEIVLFIENLSISDEIEIKSLKNLSQQFLWHLKDMINTKENLNSNIKDLKEDQIFISFNKANRDMCLKIRDKLIENNYKVCIDIDGKNCDTIEWMVNGINDSKCVLVFISEQYRQSLTCHREADYAFRRNKIIIPCIVQKNYHDVTGWLDFIMRNKIYIDFTKNTLEQNIENLKIQINKQLNKREVNSRIETTNLHSISTFSVISKPMKEINSMSEKDVEVWFKESNLNESFIFRSFFPCDGKLLVQLNEMRSSAPEFFYKSLSPPNMTINDTKIIALFALKLKELSN